MEFKVQSHDFRKTKLTDLYLKHKDILMVRDYAGHSDVKITEGYIETKNLNIQSKFDCEAEDEEEVTEEPPKKVNVFF